MGDGWDFRLQGQYLILDALNRPVGYHRVISVTASNNILASNQGRIFGSFELVLEQKSISSDPYLCKQITGKGKHASGKHSIKKSVLKQRNGILCYGLTHCFDNFHFVSYNSKAPSLSHSCLRL
jgi:hypothetical protein